MLAISKKHVTYLAEQCLPFLGNIQRICQNHVNHFQETHNTPAGNVGHF